jgi:hypothetical protein
MGKLCVAGSFSLTQKLSFIAPYLCFSLLSEVRLQAIKDPCGWGVEYSHRGA